MIDEIFDRHYQDGRKQMNDAIVTGLAGFGRAVAEAFEVLNRIEYSGAVGRARQARPLQLNTQAERGLARTALLAYSPRSFPFPLE